MRRRVWSLALPLVALCCLQAPPALAQEEADEVPAYSRNGADTCLRCHGEEVVGIFRTKHAQRNDPRTPFGRGQLQCEACHGPGGAHTKRPKKGEERTPVIQFGKGAVTPVREQNAMCFGCHNSYVGNWHTSAHDDNGIGCADCHAVHSPKDPVQSKATQSEVCGSCHGIQIQKANMLQPFSHPLREGQMACSSCHSPHGSLSEAMLNRDSVNETCYQCHADKRGPFLWEHQPVGEDCTLCHEPHGTAHPAMLKQRPPFLCQQCHGLQGHPSVPGMPSGLPDGTASSSLLAVGCVNCHSQVHGSNHSSGTRLSR